MDTHGFAMTQDHPVRTSRPIAPGCSLGPYLVLERLSSGRYAAVYLAHDVALDRTVVLKSAPPDASETDIAGLRHEARALARAPNPYLVTLHALDDSGPAPVLVLEHLAGETLAQRLARRGPLPAPDAIEVFIKLVTGLERLHHAGVIHGNIKPDNIFLATDGSPKFLGLQFAAFRDRPAAGLTARSPDLLYGAPENRGMPAVDPRADLFSLGLCLHEALTGALPFEKKNHPGRRHPPPPALLAVLAQATDKDREARFPSAVAFRQALVAATGNVRMQREAGTGRLRKTRLLRGLAVDAALVAVLGALMFALGLYPHTDGDEQATAASEATPVPAQAGQGAPGRHVGTPDKQDKYDALRRAWGG